MRLPTPLLEHPVESAIAGLLLMALLFGSAEPQPQIQAAPQSVTVSQKM